MADSDKEVPVLSRLRPPAGAVKKRTRFGRGIGSGLGKTAGRGQKGQKARQPGNIHKRHFEGGQIPLQRRLPKFGFNNIFSVVVAEVNVRDLNRFDAGATVDADALRAEGLIKGR
ncbi:partial 50S ribosomal protein L15, partial [Anaerolineae bacterium]